MKDSQIHNLSCPSCSHSLVLINLCNRSKQWVLSLLLCIYFGLVMGFSGYGQSQPESIKIGFIIRESSDQKVLSAAISAVSDANDQGGYLGKKFELIVKSCEGPWGVTSKQAVALLYEDKVCMIVAAVDGRNAHLIEQVAAKSQVVMLSTLASDPTLSRAYVPWYYRIIPDDIQQSAALTKQIYAVDNARKVAVISLDSYDGVKSAESFAGEAHSNGYPKPSLFSMNNPSESIESFSKQSWDAVVLAGTIQEGDEIILEGSTKSTFAFINFFNYLTNKPLAENVKMNFSMPEDYVYDGVAIAIESIKRFGSDPESIRAGFAEMDYIGKTGKIEFNTLGNRVAN